MESNKDFEKKILQKLDRLSNLFEISLIMQGGIAKVNKQELRDIIGVGMDRVTIITKAIGKHQNKEMQKDKKHKK